MPNAKRPEQASPALTPPLVTHPDGDDLGESDDDDLGASEAILRAAAELFTAKSPSKVTLREVADRAGVNYGLIHRHFRTKDALLVALFRRLTDYGTTHVKRSPDALAATRALFGASAGGFAELFASVVLDGADPASIVGESSAMEAYTRLIEEQWQGGATDVGSAFDPRLVAGFVMLNVMIWDLFAPYIRVLADVEDRSLPEVRDEVLRLLQHLVASTGLAARDGGVDR